MSDPDVGQRRRTVALGWHSLGRAPREPLPPLNHDVAVDRVEFQQAGLPARLLGGDDRGPATGKGIEDQSESDETPTKPTKSAAAPKGLSKQDSWERTGSSTPFCSFQVFAHRPAYFDKLKDDF